MPKIFGLFSIPDPLKSAASPSDLKKRLDWGEPALTIVDIRSRAAFNESHITGAASIPDAVLVEGVSASLELERDIYVYGDNDEQSSAAAHRLREAGYQSVAELRGGLPAWKAIKGSVETSGMSAA
ncbi:MAG: rhodanese-like domain-containing protein [Phormidesmis sp. RL_2_1]|nr:rhodanese-like domain-containing protein [Phormidesmis sp. RL_2_1]